MPGLASHWRPVPPLAVDTGDFAAMPPTYVRYTTPLWCLAAANIAKHMAQRPLMVQTARITGILRLADDTLPASVATVARTCGARFTLANTANDDVPALFDLALLSHDEPTATTILTALVARAETPTAKAQQLLWGINEYLAASPARIEAAEATAIRLDAIPAVPWQLQVEARSALLRMTSRYGDRADMQTVLEQLVAITRAHIANASADQSDGIEALVRGYGELLKSTWLATPDSAAVIAQQMQALFSPPAVHRSLAQFCTQQAATQSAYKCQAPVGTTPMDRIPLPQLITAVLNMNNMFLASATPTPAPPLRADFLFPAPVTGTHTTADTTVPTAGRVTVLFHARSEGGGCADNESMCGLDDMLQLKTLLTRYRSDMAATVLVDAMPTTPLDVSATPSEVAQGYRWYFQQYLGLPVTVAVRMRQLVQQLPAPDGRIAYGDPAYTDSYGPNQGVTVINQQQQIVYAGTEWADVWQLMPRVEMHAEGSR